MFSWNAGQISDAFRRGLVVVAAVALVVAACGSGAAEPGAALPAVPATVAEAPVNADTPAPSVPVQADPDQGRAVPANQALVQVYFVHEGTEALPVERLVGLPNVATGAVQELLDGPTGAEADDGLGTAIPAATRLNGIVVDDGRATIDLTAEFEQGGGSLNILSRLGQVVYTLTQFPSIDEVVFELDGDRATAFSGEGIDLSRPVDRSDYATILPISGTSQSPAVPVWGNDDLAGMDGPAGSIIATVALVAADDVLNVREAPGVEHDLVGQLEPGTAIIRTGAEAQVGSSTWHEVITPIGDYWVNGYYLSDDTSVLPFEGAKQVDELVEQFAALLAIRGDLTGVASERGLFVAHHAKPFRVAASDLDTILTDATEHEWPVPDGVNAGPAATFAQAIGDRFLMAYNDTDVVLNYNDWFETAPGLPDAASPIPLELASFNHVSVHRAGANVTEAVTWYVSVAFENGVPRIIGLTVDTWAP